MPIYEYYCTACQGRFKQLARQMDAPAPACPRCGNTEVERVISTVHTIHNSAYHQAQLKQEATSVDTQNTAEIAQFLNKSGRLEDVNGVYGSKVYRELVDRRAAGAEERDLTDLVDNLVEEMQTPEIGETAGAVLFSKQVSHRLSAEEPPEDQSQIDNRNTEKRPRDTLKSSKQHIDDLGWV
jgi:putative FmdB family regulatory protein